MPRQTRAAAASSSASASMMPAQSSTVKAKALATKLGVGRKSTRMSLRTAIKNSSDASDDGLDKSGPNPHISVVVPSSNRRSQKAGSTTSGETSLQDESSVAGGEETPLTSAFATPLDKGSTIRLSNRISAATSLNNVSKKLSIEAKRGSQSNRSRSRSRPAATQGGDDEELARKLQEQEYSRDAIEDSVILGGVRNQSKSSVNDTEDDLSMLSGDLDIVFGEAKTQSENSVTDTDDDLSDILSDDLESVSLTPTSSKRRALFQAAQPQKRRRVQTDDSGDESFKSAEDNSELSTPADSPDASEASEADEQPAKSKGRSSKAKKTTRRGKNASVRRVTPIWRKQGETRTDYERRKLEHAHPQLATLWDDLAAVPVVKADRTPQPAGISRTLKSFQLEGVDWMRRMETESQWKGGLLGDEMGMGKTIQAVSLIMSDYPAGKPSLVVVPPVALMQWSSEIRAYTDGKLKVLVHHNTDPQVKKLKMNDLLKYDVIMISYSGLESIHRKEVKGWKRDDGLVKEKSRIHAIDFHRLILDEAHSIKSRTTQVAKACFALKADHKWCLSGTPVQNRIGEFFSLLRFLEVEPFASYFCKECNCESLHWSQDDSGRCSSCKHTGFQHVSLFNQELLNPITSGGLEERELAMKKLRLLTDRIMLRRMKRDHTASMELPPKKVVIRNEFFGPVERDFSRSIMTNTTRTFDTYVARGVELNNYANIFGLIMQMRQVANHPDLILKKNASGGQNVLVCSICDEPAEEPIRSQCHHEFCRRCAKDYTRSFAMNGEDPDCPQCHIKLRIDFDQADIEQDEENVRKSSIINRIKMEDWHSSTKIEMLIYELFSLRSQKRTVKSIVFSQFTSMLQLVEWRLRRAGFSTVMLDGSMSPAQRQKSIDYFMNTVNVEIFLVSLKAGGVALNLTEASRVFIVDPWWNPAAEWQSADRCHRIGQKRPCQITRLCIEDSVESRMVLLQEKKANLINGTVNGDDVALGKLTPEDLQFLFRGS